MPVSAADNLMRTLQLTSYREASLAMEELNGKYILHKIRIAALDTRTCLTCISLHGTELEPGERVDDHYRGRCTEYYVVPGGKPFPDFMQADSTPGQRNFVPFQNGEDWFNGLPEARQKLQASFVGGPGKWNAFKAGTPLRAFVAEHHDKVFGRQVVEHSLTSLFGAKQAATFYQRNQGLPGIRLSQSQLDAQMASQLKTVTGQSSAELLGNRKVQLINSSGKSVTMTSEQQTSINKLLELQDPRGMRGLRKVVVYDSDAAFDLAATKAGAKIPAAELTGESFQVGAFYVPGTKTIHVPLSAITNDPVLFSHEFGHAIYKGATPTGRSIWGDAWRADPDFDRHTEYAKTSSQEAFAETYAAWVSAGKTMEWNSFQVMFDVFRRLK
jgi:hypothetical protein